MKKLNKKYTNAELAESFVFRSTLTAKQNAEASSQLSEARKKNRTQLSTDQKLFAHVLQLRFKIEDYIKSYNYDESLSFAYFLRTYIKLRYKANKHFAEDINIEETELSQILNNHRAPSDKTIVRIGLQSGIPALYWYKLVEKQKEHALETDLVLQESEAKYVKNRLNIKF